MPFARLGASSAQASSVINAVGVIMIFEFGGAPSDRKFFNAGTSIVLPLTKKSKGPLELPAVPTQTIMIESRLSSTDLLCFFAAHHQ